MLIPQATVLSVELTISLGYIQNLVISAYQ